MKNVLPALLVAAASSSASAQGVPAGFDADRFAAAVTRGGFVAVEAPASSAPYSFAASAGLVWLERPVVRVEGGAETTAVASRAALVLDGSFAFTRGFELGFALPVAAQSDALGGTTGVGDVRIVPKISFGAHVALIPALTLPTGDAARFLGAGVPSFEPSLAFAARSGGTRAAIDLGVRFRELRHALGTPVGNGLFGGAAVAQSLGPIEIIGEVRVATELDALFVRGTTPAEVVGGVRFTHGPWSLLAGGGAGVSAGYGAPLWRGFMTVAWASDRRTRATLRSVVAAATVAPIEEDDEVPEETVTASVPVLLTESEIQVGTPIFFDKDHRRVRHRFWPALDEVAQTLKDTPSIRKVKVHGHADASGPAEWNRELSLHRAEAVVAYLVSRGIDAARLEAVPFGDTLPAASNEQADGRAQNRRVVFYIVERVEEKL